MVLNISVSHQFIRIVTAFKFAENQVVPFSQNMGLDIEPPPMGHSKNNFLHPTVSRALNQCIHQRNDRIASFQ